MKNVQYLLEYFFLIILCFFLKIFSAKISLKIGELIGLVLKILLKRRVSLAHKNLSLAFNNEIPVEQRNAIISQLFKNLGQWIIEFVIFEPKDINNHIKVQGWEHYIQEKKTSKAGIIITAHFGPWEILSVFFGAKTQNIGVIYKPLKNPYINKYLLERRIKNGLELIEDHNALKVLSRKLKRGESVGILFDQNAASNGIAVTFFGKQASTYAAPASFALKKEYTVMPVLIFKRPGFRKYEIVFYRPFPLIRTGYLQRDILANTQQYNDFLQAIIKEYPEQWFGWLHKRWSGNY